jgi:hypothetical protein
LIQVVTALPPLYQQLRLAALNGFFGWFKTSRRQRNEMGNEETKSERRTEKEEAMISNSKRLVQKETTMKTTTFVKGSILAAALGIACLMPATAHAQADVAPDIYEAAGVQVMGASQPLQVAINTDATADFHGQFTLANEVNCGGMKLAPGVYSLSVKWNGTSRVVTIQRDGADMILRVREVTQRPAGSQSALLLRHAGPARTLEAVYVRQLNAVLYLDGNLSVNSNSARRERLPIS